MSDGRRISRRAFLAVCGGVVAAGAAVGGVRLLGGGPSEALTARVGEAFDDDALREIGRAYLERHPEEDGERRLVRALESRPAWRRVSDADGVRALARVEGRRDFRAGRVELVERWYLSETEARLCALATFA